MSTPVLGLLYTTSSRKSSRFTWKAPSEYTFFIIRSHKGIRGSVIVAFSRRSISASGGVTPSVLNSPTW